MTIALSVIPAIASLTDRDTVFSCDNCLTTIFNGAHFYLKEIISTYMQLKIAYTVNGMQMIYLIT